MVEEGRTSGFLRRLKPHKVSAFPSVKMRAAPCKSPINDEIDTFGFNAQTG